MQQYKNLASFFKYATELFSERNAIFWRDPEHASKTNDKYTGINGKKLKELVYLASRAIEQLGLKRGDKAAIISETRLEWVITDFACIMNGITTVPIYVTMTSQQVKFILEHSEARICFASTKLLAEKVSAVFDELPTLKHIISFNKTSGEPDHIINFEDIIYKEVVEDKRPYNETEADNYFTAASQKINEDDLLTIIYTSGTTGNPKGVCLSHKNILANVKQCTDSFKITDTDRFLSFLPLAHTYERTAGYYLPLSKGAEIYYAQSIDTLSVQMQETMPTVILTVPVLFVKMYDRISKSIKALPKFKQAVTNKALSVGLKYRNNKKNFLWRMADKQVFAQMRERTGGRLRFFISGGSALNVKLAEFFDSIGITILQGYGMTEASPVISVNRDGTDYFETVGPPLVGLTVKIAEDGEILVSGDNVMPGYYKNEKDTSETLIAGWLHTGDIGEIDSNGCLKITDRKKTLIKTSGGKYISLTHVEDTIGTSKYINQIIAFASDHRQFVIALVVPDFDELKAYAESGKIQYTDNISLIENNRIKDFIDKEIDSAQKHLAKYERVRKFELLPVQFTIESGEMTPTLKLKRKVIEERYKSTIDKFYE